MTPQNTTTNILVPRAFQKYSTYISSYEKIFPGKTLLSGGDLHYKVIIRPHIVIIHQIQWPRGGQNPPKNPGADV